MSASSVGRPWLEVPELGPAEFWPWVDRMAVLHRLCPHCWAPAGEKCVTVTGQNLGSEIGRPHAARFAPVYAAAMRDRMSRAAGLE